ncbi:COBRA-like protein [Quillaja saponaria]|uniref:COBRA-like protein n=1 Tax=Quillaja saponaria TaxID=32244 RepID=A0AAD7QCF0_QUISA|nr:COBRA-like protein [Quillaja saponaria]
MSFSTVVLECADDTGMFYGMKYYNDLLMEAGQFGNVQSEVLLRKDKNTFSFKQGWEFPRKVYFNGDECMLPPPDTYPFLPNSAHENAITISFTAASVIIMLLFIW